MILNPFKRAKPATTPDQGSQAIDPLEKSDAFISHWKRLPKSGLIPHLQDFLDRPEPLIQPDIAILDIPPTGEIAVRLYGTRRVKTFNKNFTGSSNPLEAYQGEIELKAREILDQVVTRPCGWRATVFFESSINAKQLRTIAALLPLHNENDDTKSLLHHQYLIDDVEPDEYPKIVKSFADRTYIDIGAGIPNT